MFECARCGSAYSASHVGVETCPRCLLLDRVQAPLTFKLFKRSRFEIVPRRQYETALQPLQGRRPVGASAPADTR